MSSCDGNCNQCKALCKLKGLCVLTKQENFVFEIIDKISDKEEKEKFLMEYLEQIRNQSSENIPEKTLPNYDLKEIMTRINIPVS